ncbi:MAG TPA: glycosyltransferase family 39 protein [Thermoanaerobaculia bacterium]|nr:glycosyltransferase family 39 protein [Thermoanaerobaculia bacterium]
MNGVLPSLGGVLLFLIAGLGIGELVPAVRSLPLPRRLGWAFLFGMTGVNGALYALSHWLDVPLRRPAILATVAACALLGAVRLFRKERRRTPRRGIEGPFQIAAAALLCLISLGLLAEAMTDPLTSWDSRMTWAAQAIWIRDDGTVDAEVLQRKMIYVTHPQYPLLLPIAQVVVQETFDVPTDLHAFRAVYAGFFAAFLLLLWDGARRWAGRVPALLAALAAAGVPALTFWGDSGAISGYSDQPLGCFFGAGLLLLLRAHGRRQGRWANFLGGGFLLAGAVLTKNEGMLLAVLALGAAALPILLRHLRHLRPLRRWRPLSRQLPRLAAAAVPVALALVLLRSWRAAIPNRQDEMYEHLVRTQEIWPDAFVRIPDLLLLILEQTYNFERWTLFWIVVPVVFLAGWRGWAGRRRGLSLALAAGALAPLAVAWGAYLFHPAPESLIEVTWTRFLVQGSLPLFLLLALALRDVLRRSGWPWRATSKRHAGSG